MLDNAKLDFWIKNELNLLITGDKGIGKSAIIIDAFNRSGLKWKYFSASTMDVFTDFIGIPRASIDPVSGNEYLELIKPKDFANDEVEAIFFDEFNRANPKVLNAVMELMQFKSINGKKFNNLKLIWAAVNPSDGAEAYSVNTIDPAQLDRFHVHVTLPYSADMEFFKNKYGEKGETAVIWWKQLSDEHKQMVSPRRLEYAVTMHNMGGDVHDVLPKEVNTNELVTQLSQGAFTKRLLHAFSKKNEKLSTKEINDNNFYNACIEEILVNPEYLAYFIPFLNDEKLSQLLTTNAKVQSFFKKPENVTSGNIKQALRNLVECGTTQKHVLRLYTEVLPLAGTVYTEAGELLTAIRSFINDKTRLTNTNLRIDMLAKIKASYVGDVSIPSTDHIHRTVCDFMYEFLIRTPSEVIDSNQLDSTIYNIIDYIDSRKTFTSTFLAYFDEKRQELITEFGTTRVERVAKYINDMISSSRQERAASMLKHITQFA